MQLDEHVAAVESEGARFAAAARGADLDAAVPTCPDWDVRRLVRHVGIVHLWAAAHVAFPHDEPEGPFTLDEAGRFWPDIASGWPPDSELADWYAVTNASLVHVLRSATDEARVWTFLPAPSPVHFWARRQSLEIGVHRFDLERARSKVATTLDPGFAADGLAEFLAGFAVRPGRITSDTAQVVQLHARDVGVSWRLELGPAGSIAARTTADDADLTVVGDAADLLLLVWNRLPSEALSLEGDTSILDRWRETAAIRWS